MFVISNDGPKGKGRECTELDSNISLLPVGRIEKSHKLTFLHYIPLSPAPHLTFLFYLSSVIGYRKNREGQSRSLGLNSTHTLPGCCCRCCYKYSKTCTCAYDVNR
jgi:hypothetical protein